MNCQKCGTKLGLGARRCDVCGTEVQKNVSGQQKDHSVFLLAAVVMVLVAVLSGLASYGISALVDSGVSEIKKLLQEQAVSTQTESLHPNQTTPPQQTVPTVPPAPRMVTISYLVEERIYHFGDGDPIRHVREYAENWHQKTAFTVDEYLVNYNGTSLLVKLVYTEKTEFREFAKTANGFRITVYDDYGREILLKTVFNDAYAEEHETKEKNDTNVYDTHGLIKQVQVEELDRNGNILNQYTSDWQYTMQGKNYLLELADYSYLYDEEGKELLLVQYDPQTGKETWRRESLYDAWGNLLTAITYKNGQQESKTEYIYQTVEVSDDFARRFPMFKIVD